MIESVEHGKTKVMVGHYQLRGGDTKSQLDTICSQGRSVWFMGNFSIFIVTLRCWDLKSKYKVLKL